MSLYRKIDDWFLGFKTRSVRAKDSSIPNLKIQSPGKIQSTPQIR